MESHYGVCRHDIHSNIHSLSELRSLGKTLTELVVDAGCEAYTKTKKLNFSAYKKVTRIVIGNQSFKRVKEVIVEGLPLLVELKFGEGCFSYADEVSEEMPNGTLRVAVADKGCGIPDVSKAMEPLFTTGGAERAGLGFAVMESFMDSVKVRSAPGKGTRVTLSKRLGTR